MSAARFEALLAGTRKRDCTECSEDVVNMGRYLLVLDTEHGDVLVPFVQAIVLHVDVAGGRLVLDPPAGLFD